MLFTKICMNGSVQTAEKYSSKDDYIISYIYTPMVHMITKRKPALEDTYIDFYEFPGVIMKTRLTV